MYNIVKLNADQYHMKIEITSNHNFFELLRLNKDLLQLLQRNM